jgi:aminoglycoside phosphotransferase (APT) family kinase protein
MDLDWIASVAGARHARRGARLQSLWSGYGEIVRVELEGGEVPSVVVKRVTPPPRPKNGVSDARKRRSYDVERVFYETFASRCSAASRVPRFFGSRVEESGWLFVLEDLDAAGFAERRHAPALATLDRCLSWLASFHATFLGEPPAGLWKAGTYWHLATRRDELRAVGDASIQSLAPRIDAKLASATHRTFVHGDAKLANFCFSRGATGVAAVDFQYVGGGCGMKDVAYLVSGEADEERALDSYFVHLRRALADRSIDPAPVEAEWRALYRFACADFYRFLAGWAPSHFARDRHAQRVLREVGWELGASPPVRPGNDDLER